MKRVFSLFFAVMLLFQMTTSSFSFTPTIYAQESVVKDVTQEGTTDSYRTNWSVEGMVITEGTPYVKQLPERLKIPTTQKGSLTISDIIVGSYEIKKAGNVTLLFNEEIHNYPDGNGSFTFHAQDTTQLNQDTPTVTTTNDSTTKPTNGSSSESTKDVTTSSPEHNSNAETATTETTQEETKKNTTEKTDGTSPDETEQPTSTSGEGKTENQTEKTETSDSSSKESDQQEVSNEEQTNETKEEGTKEGTDTPNDSKDANDGVTDSTSEQNTRDASEENAEAGMDPESTEKDGTKQEKESKDENSSTEDQELSEGKTDENSEQDQSDLCEDHAVTEDTESSAKEEGQKCEELKQQSESSPKTLGELKALAGEAITENILTEASLSYDGDAAGIDTVIAIDYKWALENGHGYKAGAQFNFTIPPELEVYNAVDDVPLTFNGETIGYFSIDENGNATILFTEFIEQYSNINGKLQVLTELSEETIVTEDKEIQVKPIKDGASITIPLDFSPGGKSVVKSGATVGNSYNAEEINWTVDFNKQLKTLSNAVLQDPIQAGQTLKPGSLQVYKLVTQLDGTVTEGDLVGSGSYSVGQVNGGDFTIEFNDDIQTAYRLKYTTTLTDQDKTSFTNDATLLSDGNVVDNASARVNVKRGSPLEKKAIGYDSVTQTIEWQIKYNYNEKTIAQQDAVLEDLFTGSQELISDSFSVSKVTINGNGNESGTENFTNYTMTPKTEGDKNGFTFQFDEDVDAAYKITYKTKASERVFESEKITNTVETGGVSRSASRNVNQQILFKSLGTPNYGDKTVPWTITFNKDKQEMNNVTLTDVFTNQGLTFKANTLVIKEDGTTLEEGSDFTLTENGDGFSIVFLNQITGKVTLSFTTDFNYEARSDKNKDYLNNKVDLNWKDAENEDRTKTVNRKFTPDTYTKSNGFKNGSYDATTKEITWNIGINYNLKTLNNAEVRDYIEGNQILLKDTIKVYKMNLTGGANGTEQRELVDPSEYKIVDDTDGAGNPGFKVQFTNSINAPYQITYKTSLSGLDLVNATYSNTASLWNDGAKETSYSAVVNIPYGGKYTNKTGSQDGKIINWRVGINYAQSQVSNATITDNPSTNQALLENSFTLYKTSVSPNGSVTKGEALERGVDYTLNLSQDPDSFTLQFSNEINEPYILEYQSLILAPPQETVSNNISFNGESIEEVTNESSSSITVKRTAAYGDGTGEVGALTVTKKDSETGTSLEGAVFTLKDAGTGTVIGTKTTNSDGEVLFERLLYGSYVLVEDEAPEGYVKQNGSTTITIDQAYDKEDPVKNGNTITVNNDEVKQGVQLTKKDKKTGNVLEGAVFKLIDEEENEVQTGLTTEADGKLVVEDLEPGSYQFIETKAPVGYELNTSPKSFKISKDQTTYSTITFTNEQRKGSVELTKKSEAGNVLEGAVYKLLSKDGQVIQTDLKTEEDGKLTVNDLAPGDYKFVETEAPFGHEVNESPVLFTIPFNPQEVVTVSQNDELSTSSVELTKYGEDNAFLGDEGKVLEGVIFKLLDENGMILKDELKTNAQGKLVVNDLKPGTYTFQETDTLNGYQLLEDPISFTIVLGQTEATEVKAVNDLKTGSVTLNKVGENKEPLKGAEFKLLDGEGNELQSGLTTSADGSITVEDLKPGNYQFVETKPPFGHDLNETPVPFTISFDQEETITVTHENERSTSSVELTKYGEDNAFLGDEGKVLEGVMFDLETLDGKTIQSDLSTNGEGKIVVSDLKPGNYQFVETKTLDGYVLDGTPVPFEIKLGQTESTTVEVTNDLKTGSVQMLKVGEDNEPLEGATFKLLDEQGNLLQSDLTTNTDGLVVIEDLKPGNYQLVETKSPFGHDLDETPIPFTISFDPQETVKVTSGNEQSTSSVELTKYGEDNAFLGDEGKVLEGVTFKLLGKNGRVVRDELKTNEEGKIVVGGLKPGSYTFEETETIDGYLLLEDSISFTIKLGQKSSTKVNAINELKTGSVTLSKIGEDNEPLMGAEFKLLDAEGNELEAGLTTSDSGEITVSGLKPGQYQFVETKAPFGHDLNETPVPFTISFNEEGVMVTSENERSTSSVELTKYGEDNAFLGDEGKVLEGVKFDLETTDGETIHSDLSTNAEGKIVVSELKPGNYQFVETKALDGYVLNEKPIPFEIKLGQTERITVEATNDLKTGSVQLLKVGEKNNPLEDATFNLLDEQGNLLQSDLVTNADGLVVVESLKPGKYQFVETNAPVDYLLDETPVFFEIRMNPDEITEVKMENKRKRGAVTIVKVDEDTDETLAGAVFEVVNADGEVVITVTTGEDGSITVNDLVVGDYHLEETKAPAGYVKREDPISFTITADQEEAERVTVQNKQQKVKEEDTKTDEDSSPTTDDSSTDASGKGDQHQDDEVSSDELPQTGEQWLRYLLYIGLGFIGTGSMLIVRRRRVAE